MSRLCLALFILGFCRAAWSSDLASEASNTSASTSQKPKDRTLKESHFEICKIVAQAAKSDIRIPAFDPAMKTFPEQETRGSKNYRLDELAKATLANAIQGINMQEKYIEGLQRCLTANAADQSCHLEKKYLLNELPAVVNRARYLLSWALVPEPVPLHSEDRFISQYFEGNPFPRAREFAALNNQETLVLQKEWSAQLNEVRAQVRRKVEDSVRTSRVSMDAQSKKKLIDSQVSEKISEIRNLNLLEYYKLTTADPLIRHLSGGMQTPTQMIAAYQKGFASIKEELSELKRKYSNEISKIETTKRVFPEQMYFVDLAPLEVLLESDINWCPLVTSVDLYTRERIDLKKEQSALISRSLGLAVLISDLANRGLMSKPIAKSAKSLEKFILQSDTTRLLAGVGMLGKVAEISGQVSSRALLAWSVKEGLINGAEASKQALELERLSLAQNIKPKVDSSSSENFGEGEPGLVMTEDQIFSAVSARYSEIQEIKKNAFIGIVAAERRLGNYVVNLADFSQNSLSLYEKWKLR